MINYDSFYTESPRRKIVTCLSILFILINLQGCERGHHLRANVLSGYLHTPWGKFEFQQVSSARQASDMKRYSWETSWRGHLYADAGDVLVVLPLIGQSAAFLGKIGSSYSYPNYNLNITASSTKLFKKDKGFIGNLSKFDILNKKFGTQGFGQYRGGGFKLPRINEVNTPYNIVIPFNLSGDDFLIDVWVEVTKEGYWALDIGVPATP